VIARGLASLKTVADKSPTVSRVGVLDQRAGAPSCATGNSIELILEPRNRVREPWRIARLASTEFANVVEPCVALAHRGEIEAPRADL
jgi:hypothetical protein